jgi:hypothetical protein
MRSLTFIITALLSFSTFADHHANVPIGSGAFSTLMVQAQDPDAYIAMLKKNPAPFKTIGSSVAGACVTKTGQDYPGQMFIFNGFDSFEDAMAAGDKYDAMKATPELMAIREVKYSVMFKPLKQYTLDPGFERLWRVKISNENLQPYVNKIAELEAALRAAGHKINVGVFQPIGGGVHEAIHLRAASPSSAASGRILDEAFASAPWMSIWAEATALVEEVLSDNYEQCEIIYTAE